jgi:hypothetical protein
MDHYPILRKILLVGGIPFVLIGMVMYGFAKADVYIPFNKKNVSNEISGKKVHYFINFAALLFVFYNLFCIYVYFYEYSGDVANLHAQIIKRMGI